MKHSNLVNYYYPERISDSDTCNEPSQKQKESKCVALFRSGRYVLLCALMGVIGMACQAITLVWIAIGCCVVAMLFVPCDGIYADYVRRMEAEKESK